MAELVLAFIIAFVVIAGIAMKILKWLEDGGLYYMKHPAAKIMDDAKKRGSSVDYMEALNEVERVKQENK
jgi:hypothetical protein